MGNMMSSEQEEMCSEEVMPSAGCDDVAAGKQWSADKLSEDMLRDAETSTAAATSEVDSTAATSEDEGEAPGAPPRAKAAAPEAQEAAAGPAAAAAAEAAPPPAPELPPPAVEPPEALSGPGVDPEHTSIIFDWDDTLLPTSFITDAVRICPPKCGSPALPRGRAGPRRGSARSTGGSCISKDFPCYAALQRHAELIRRVLTCATGHGRVAIVTSASRPWVFESAEQYLPGLNLPGLFQDLKIPVYYAGEHKGSTATNSADTDLAMMEHEEELDDHSAQKRNAMAEFLQLNSASQGEESGRKNLFSIGDSLAEKYAAKAAAGAAGRKGAQRPVCKTVKLMCDPSLKQLSDQLLILERHLVALASHDGDFDLCALEPSDLAEQAEALLGI